VLSNAVAGVWALAAIRAERLRHRSLWWFVVFAELSAFAVVILGVTYQNTEEIDPPPLHDLYGFSTLFAVAILYGYRQQLRDRVHLLYGLGSLFIMGLGIRAMVLH
jgi:hypothetical protein